MTLPQAVRGTFPEAIDNTMVSAYRACPKKFWWRHSQSLQRTETSIHLTSGGAFAKGLEVVRKRYFDHGDSFDVALAKGAAALYAAYGHVEPHPKYTAKSAHNLVGALAFYFEQWPINRGLIPYRPSEGARHTIEWNFSVPIGLTHPDTGKPLLYCGRFDMVARHEGFQDALFGEDDKTTTQLGETWFTRWRLSNQLIGYAWGSREHGLKLAGFNVRGISLLKNSYGSAEDLKMINEWQIDRWLANLRLTVARMIKDYQENTWEMDMGKTCSEFGGCDYLPLCESPNPSDWIEINFVKNVWNPLASRD